MRTSERWTVLRSLISAAFILLVVYVTIADYPYDWPIWYWACMDPNGYLHEMFYIFVGWHVVMWWTLYWQKKLMGCCPLCGRLPRNI